MMTPTTPRTIQPGTPRPSARLSRLRRDQILLGSWKALVAALLLSATLGYSASGQTTTPTKLPVLVADFNHDGIPDVLVPTDNGPTATISFGSIPFGTFDTSTKIVNFPSACTGTFPDLTVNQLAVGDFNGDGIPDLFFFCGGSSTGIMLGNGDGTFATPNLLARASSVAAAMIGDFDHNGKLDIALIGSPDSTQPTTIFFYSGSGTGTFANPVYSPLGTHPTYISSLPFLASTAADVNGDGYPDLVFSTHYSDNSESISIYGNNQDGTFGIASNATRLPNTTIPLGTSPAVRTFSLFFGNVYGSSKPDLLVGNFGTTTPGILLFQNTSTASTFSFIATTPISYPTYAGMQVGSFTGTGFTDIAVANGTNIVVLANDGTGNFTQSYTALSTSTTNSLFTAADANGDGYADIYTASSLSGTLSLAVNLVTGTATATTAPFSLPGGTAALSATWPGNLNFIGSTATGTQTVTAAPTSIALTSSENPSVAGDNVNLVATVSSPLTTATLYPTGTLTISDGSTVLGSIAIGITSNSGTLFVPISTLSVGTHTIIATYAGDNIFAASTSPTVLQVVTQPPAVAPTLAWTPGPITVGTPLSGVQLNAVATDATGAVVPGAFAYTPHAGTIFTSAGSQILSVAFTPTDLVTYKPATLSVPITVLPAAQTPLTTNLLLNPGAELGLVDGAIPNWTPAGEGTPTVDAGAFDAGINPHTGTYDFLGQNGASDTLSQTVSLVTGAVTTTLIDTGGISASLSFWEQGLSQGTPSDDASVTLIFLDSDNATLNSVTTDEVDSHDSTWQNLTASYPIPVGTRSITYTMNFIRHSGSDLDAFVDDNSLILTAAAALPSTTTTLALTSGRATATTVPSGTPVTLTATVTATHPVIRGQVNFCDAAATYCTDTHLLGTAQLITGGTATFRFIPGIGVHSYKAVFVGTTSNATSASTAQALTVTGPYATQTTITSSGTASGYSLTGTVVSTGASANLAPTGTVSFLNTSRNNALLGTAALGANVAGVSFKGLESATTIENPQTRSVVGDFNGDGILDLATANSAPDQNPTVYANTVTISLGNGDGTFTTLPNSPVTGAQPQSIVVADFNSDGKLDLATANENGNTVTILLGNGDGTFTAAASPTLSGSPYGIVAADFNGDGNVDLAISRYNGGLSILLGNGNGTFGQPLNSLSGSLASIDSADFNGDGKIDLVARSISPTSAVLVLLGNGDGTFTQSATIADAAQESSLNSLAVGDFNGDGKPDLAVTRFNGNTVAILTGKGDGTFTASVAASATATGPIDVRTADFNGDGKLDLAVLDFPGTGETILLGNGDGTFTSAPILTGVSSYDAITVGDFNGDGVPDLAATDGNSNLEIALTQLTQTASASLANVSIAGSGVNQVVAAYAGNTSFSNSTSTPIALTAQLIPTTTTLTTSLTPSPAATPVTFTATIAPILSNGIPATGTITFTDGTNPLGTVTPNQTGIATLPATLTPGNHTIRAVYSGDTNFATSANTLSQVITPATGLTFSNRNLTFANQTVGTKSASQAVLVSNYTGFNTSIYDILLILGAAPSDFIQTNNCPNVLLANATCTVNIAFTPHGVGFKSAGIEIDDDLTLSSQSINFSGTGTGGILQVNPGNLRTIAGTGTAGYTGDNGLATAATLNLPAGVAVDPTGIVYIADELNNVIRKVDLAGNITTIAGTGTGGYTGDGGLAAAATLKYPATVTLDTAGNLYIFDDGNNAVRKITTSTGIISTIAGTGTGGHSGDGGPATSARLNQPQGGKFDKLGNLYIPDCVGSNLRKIDTSGIITTVAGNFTAGFSGDGGPATSAQLYCPSGVDIDAAGNLYIADDVNNRIRKVDTQGIITTIAGDGNPTANGDGGPAVSAELNLPNDLALDAAGNLYIADSGNNRIRKIDTTGTITTVAGGLQNAGSAGVNTPLSLTVTPTGNLYFVDSGNNAVRELFPAGATPFPATPVGTSAPPQTLTISNIGNVSTTIVSAQSFTLTGNPADFALTGGTCLPGATLAANGGSCTLQIAFTPTATGLRMLTVSIADTALNSPQSFTISGTGSTGTPTLAWTPAVATISYGTPLSAQQLNATSAIPGTITYTPALGTILPAGPQILSATFIPTDTIDYATVITTRTITVTQATPTLAWATPAAIPQGTALSATQLNATATGFTGASLPGTFTYTPAAGTIPAAGTQTLSVTFTPTDTIDYTTATTTVRLTVTGITLTSITPNNASLGDPAKTITLIGSGFNTATVAQVNGVSIATTYVNPTTLTSIVPATNFAAIGTLTVTVVNVATATRSQAIPLTVTAAAASVTLTGPSTTQPSTQPTLALTVTNPYPVPLTATFTLSFASTVTPTVDDPAIQFANGGRTFTFTVAANSTLVPAIQLQAGTVAGTITIPLTLTAAGVNVTPATLQPVTIVVPAAIPAVTTASITRGSGSFTVTIHGFSNTREVATAAFHFVPATGAQIDTPDVTIPVGPIFSGWFTSAPSVPYGSTFTYTQVFNVSDTAANIGSVQVTLTNSVGVSTTYTAQ